MQSTDLVMLTHTKDFEGKLSGNLCDCFAYGVPFLAAPLEPVTTLSRRHGPIGFMCDFDDSDWTRRFLDEFDHNELAKRTANINNAADHYSREAIVADLTSAVLA
jgi:hypothetical protein